MEPSVKSALVVSVVVSSLLCGLLSPVVESSEDPEDSSSGETEDEISELHPQDTDDVVDKFLSIVETYERSRKKCAPGTEYNLGDGVVAQYGVRRFKAQAMAAVVRANFLTRLWKEQHPGVVQDEHFFYTAVRSLAEGDPDLFAAGNCYDAYQFKPEYRLFCPYAYKLHNDSNEIMVKDLSVEYPYLGEQFEFFYQPKQNAIKKLEGVYNISRGE